MPNAHIFRLPIVDTKDTLSNQSRFYFMWVLRKHLYRKHLYRSTHLHNSSSGPFKTHSNRINRAIKKLQSYSVRKNLQQVKDMRN